MYLRCSCSEGLGQWSPVEVLVDADYALKACDWRSVFGGVVMCAGACVLVYSRMQKSVKILSPKGEYVSVATGFRKRFFMRCL